MPSVTRKSTGRTRRAVVESNVFSAVERLLAEGASYTELGVQQIADAAGIGRSTFYVHFVDKSDLLIRLTRAATEELFGAAEAWLGSFSAEEGYEALVVALSEVASQRRQRAGVIEALAEVAAYDRDVRMFWRERIERMAALFRDGIVAEQEAGRTSSDVNADHTATFLAWGVERTFVQHDSESDPQGDDPFAAAMARVIWLGIYGSSDQLPGAQRRV